MNDGMVEMTVVLWHEDTGAEDDKGMYLVYHVPRVGELVELPVGGGRSWVMVVVVVAVRWREMRPDKRQQVSLLVRTVSKIELSEERMSDD